MTEPCTTASETAELAHNDVAPGLDCLVTPHQGCTSSGAPFARMHCYTAGFRNGMEGIGTVDHARKIHDTQMFLDDHPRKLRILIPNIEKLGF